MKRARPRGLVFLLRGVPARAAIVVAGRVPAMTAFCNTTVVILCDGFEARSRAGGRYVKCNPVKLKLSHSISGVVRLYIFPERRRGKRNGFHRTAEKIATPTTGCETENVPQGAN